MHRVSAVVRFLQGLIAPWELHRLRRRLPTTPRLWVQIKSGIRPETDAEYLVRLRERAREKKASRSAAVNPRDTTATRRTRLNGRCCGVRRVYRVPPSKSAAARATQRSNAASDV